MRIDNQQIGDAAEVPEYEPPELDGDPLGNVVLNDDGTATVGEDEPPLPDTGFYDNLAESLDVKELDDISNDLLEKIKLDRESRKKRDEKYEEGIRRSGLGDDAPGGAQFNGASRVVHPLLAEACIDFSARTMKEIFPPKGPVKSHILSKGDEDACKRAELKTKVLNWQLTKQMREYREEMEQLTTQEPMGGSQYLKIWHDPELKRHRSEFVPVDMLLLPYAASGLYSSERVTHVQDITEQTFDGRVESELYRDVGPLGAPAGTPELTRTAKANEKVEGKTEDPYNEDGLRRIYEIAVYWKFKEDEKAFPYLVHIDDWSEKVLAVYRNWEEEDERCEKLDWIVEFKFIPWRGAYGIGLPHLIGGISGALTGALRALLDSAHINNAATMLKLKGLRDGPNKNISIDVTQVQEIDAPPQIDDIRKVAMPMPFNPPSPVLFQLLGFLSDAGKGVVGTAEESIADASNSMPVGTTLALIEQGSQVYASIHTRHHFAQQRALDIICRLNKKHPEVLEDAMEALKEEIDPNLFDENSDIQPVSDPNIFSETQRYAQIQAVGQVLANPALPQGSVNVVAFSRIQMEMMKFDRGDEVLPEPPKATRTDPVNENMLATKAQPIEAYMEQDHIAHLIVHLDFCDSPILGSNPVLTMPAVPSLVQHSGEHISMFYSQHMRAAVAAWTEVAGAADMDEAHMSEGIKNAVASAQQQIAQALAPIMPMLQRASQVAMSAAPKPPMDPQSQVAMQLGQQKLQQDGQAQQAEAQRKAQADAQTFQLKQAEMAAADRINQMEVQAAAQAKQLEESRLAQDEAFDRQVQLMEQSRMRDHEVAMQQAEVFKNESDNKMKQFTELTKNNQDNQTAIIVERMKEGIAQSAANAKPPVSLNLGESTAGAMTDTMRPLIEALGQQFQGFADSQRSAIEQSHAVTTKMIGDLHKLHAAPKMIVRDAMGRPIGVQSKLD